MAHRPASAAPIAGEHFDTTYGHTTQAERNMALRNRIEETVQKSDLAQTAYETFGTDTFEEPQVKQLCEDLYSLLKI